MGVGVGAWRLVGSQLCLPRLCWQPGIRFLQGPPNKLRAGSWKESNYQWWRCWAIQAPLGLATALAAPDLLQMPFPPLALPGCRSWLAWLLALQLITWQAVFSSGPYSEVEVIWENNKWVRVGHPKIMEYVAFKVPVCLLGGRLGFSSLPSIQVDTLACPRTLDSDAFLGRHSVCSWHSSPTLWHICVFPGHLEYLRLPIWQVWKWSH